LFLRTRKWVVMKQTTSEIKEIFNSIEQSLIEGWNFLLTVGTYAALFTMGIGAILWFSGFDTVKGKRMLLGGVILCAVVRILATISPRELIQAVLGK